MRILIGVGLFLLSLVVGVGFAYGMGAMFDAVMGTTALPIFMLAGATLGATSQGAVWAASDNMGKFVTYVVSAPMVSVCSALAVNGFFPDTAAAFLEMVSYEGSVVGFAFLGTLCMIIPNCIMAGIVAFITSITE